MNLHEFIDFHYTQDGDRKLEEWLKDGEEINALIHGEAPIHVASRRRRKRATEILLEHGAEVNMVNDFGKTAWTHAIRRGFTDITGVLEKHGARKELNYADQLAVAISNLDLEAARKMLAEHPACAFTGNPEEDRLLADIAGRAESEPVSLLIDAGADLTAPGLDDGTPLHMAAWFGQPQNVKILLEAGAPLDIFDHVHESSPLGWAIHGSRYSGNAENRQQEYTEIVKMLLDAGSSLYYPGDPAGDAYLKRLHQDATPVIRKLLPDSL